MDGVEIYVVQFHVIIGKDVSLLVSICLISEKCEIQGGYRTCVIDDQKQDDNKAKFAAQNYKQQSFAVYGLLFAFAVVIALVLIVSNGAGAK